jgi:large subunit ribosomal protein L25
MEKLELKVKVRDKTGKGYARRLREKGFVPAVLYGPHLKEAVPIEVEISKLRGLLSTLSEGEKIITLELVNKDKDNKKEVIIKDAQQNWLKGELLHIDFYEIKRGEKISTEVPLRLAGEAPGVKKGGVVEQLVRQIEIECLPENIPPHIDIDLKDLDIGDSLRVKDLKLPPTVKVLTNPEEIVVSILSPISEEELEKLEEEKGVVAEEVEVVRKEKKEEVEEKKEGLGKKKKE